MDKAEKQANFCALGQWAIGRLELAERRSRSAASNAGAKVGSSSSAVRGREGDKEGDV